MKKKTIALLLVMVMIFGISVGGTIAYLTDKEAVTNTFTVGNVDIKLTEKEIKDGVATGKRIQGNADATVGNQYHLLPGLSYDKDPMVTILEGSEESYIRMFVTITDCKDVDAAIAEANAIRAAAVPAQAAIQLTDMFGGYDASKWLLQGMTKVAADTGDDYSRIYEFRYYESVTANADSDKDLEPLFTTLSIPGEIDNDSLASIAEMKIIVEAHAIQKAGFDDAAAAWAAWTVNN